MLFKYEKMLIRGIDYYNQKKFAQALEMFSQAVTINSYDFLASFWAARSCIHQQDVANAHRYLERCQKLCPSTQCHDLITCWENVLNEVRRNKEEYEELLSELDQNTNEILQSLSNTRDYSFADFLIIGGILAFIFILGPFVVAFKMISSENAFILSLTILMMWYYHKISILPISIGLRALDFFRRVKVLLRNHVFIYLLIGFSLSVALSAWEVENPSPVSIKLINKIQAEPVMGFITLICGVIYEEIFFRGTIFGWLEKYLEKFSRGYLKGNDLEYLALILTSLLFVWYHGLGWEPWLFATSLVYTYAFGYFNTLLVPIILHYVYNLIILLITYYKWIL